MSGSPPSIVLKHGFVKMAKQKTVTIKLDNLNWISGKSHKKRRHDKKCSPVPKILHVLPYINVYKPSLKICLLIH